MTREEKKKLRRHYQALTAQLRILEKLRAAKSAVIDLPTAALIFRSVDQLGSDFPDFLPPFDRRQTQWEGTLYLIEPIQTFLATVLAYIESAIEDEDETPVTETRSFAFIREAEIRKIIERDYLEIQRAFVAQCWKATIILCGGVIEAILLDALLVDADRAKAAKSAPSRADLNKWDLANLIDVAVELDAVPPAVSKLSHSVREYRNLIHPGNEVRNRLACNQEEARIAIEVLHILHRELSS